MLGSTRWRETEQLVLRGDSTSHLRDHSGDGRRIGMNTGDLPHSSYMQVLWIQCYRELL